MFGFIIYLSFIASDIIQVISFLQLMQVFCFFQMLCKAMGILLHFFLTAMFSWALVEAWHLYALLLQTYTKNKRTDVRKRYYILGYGEAYYLLFICITLYPVFHWLVLYKSCWHGPMHQSSLVLCP